MYIYTQIKRQWLQHCQYSNIVMYLFGSLFFSWVAFFSLIFLTIFVVSANRGHTPFRGKLFCLLKKIGGGKVFAILANFGDNYFDQRIILYLCSSNFNLTLVIQKLIPKEQGKGDHLESPLCIIPGLARITQGPISSKWSMPWKQVAYLSFILYG